jgi:DNA-binding MurR/RpiR family transcriptional regulator
MILETIRQLYPQLTKSQKRLADFIVSQYREAAFMTASRLARKLTVNEATVIRFAQRLGYSGYPELTADIQAVVRAELQPAAEEQTPLLAALNQEAENLNRALSHISPEVAQQALAMLHEAQRVIVLGQGLAAPIAQLFCLSLRTLGIAAESPMCDPLSLALALGDVGEGCVVVAMAAVSETPEVTNALRVASSHGARTLALCWSPIASVAQVADVAIAWPSSDVFPLPSTAIAAIVVDALVQSLASSRLDAARGRMEAYAQNLELVLGRRQRQ